MTRSFLLTSCKCVCILIARDKIRDDREIVIYQGRIKMGFWIFMLLMDLLIPLALIGFGRLFSTRPPEKINAAFGYRTAMSMKNRDTWEFAHKFCGKLWFIYGFVLLPISIIPLIFVLNRSVAVIGTVGGIVCIIQFVLLVSSIFHTETALKKTFDQNGFYR